MKYGDIGDRGCMALCKALQVNNTLESLGLKGNKLGDEGAQSLTAALRVNNTLKSLNLRHNTLGDECAHSFVSALRITRALRTLGIENSFLAGMVLQSDTQLQHLHGMRCDDTGACLIAEGLKVNNKSLKSLDIRYGRIGDQGCIALAHALQVNPTLEKLILDENQIGEAGLEALISALHINRSLQHLSLNGNYFGEAGATFIAEALTGNKSLKRLGMNHCEVDDQGCKALAQALQVNNTLETLEFNWNWLGDAGVRAFIPTLRINSTLRHLEIEGDPLPGKETAEEFLQVVCQLLRPVWIKFTKRELGVCPTASLLVRLRLATFFNCDFDEKCRGLRDGTISDGHASFRWFLPLLGSTHPLVKKTVLFLLLRQRAEVAAQSLQLLPGKGSKRRRNQ